MVRLENITKEQLQRLHEIVTPIIDPNTGQQARTPKGALKWRGVGKAAKEFGVSRQTITLSWLTEHPTDPQRQTRVKIMKPKIVAEFEKTQAYEIIQGHEFAKDIQNTLFQGWKFLGKVDPVTWNHSHYKILRQRTYNNELNPLYKHKTSDIGSEHATNLRRFLRHYRPENKDDCIDVLKNVKKRPAGARIEWYLDAEEIIPLIHVTERLDVLMYEMVELESGARPGAICYGKDSKGHPLPKDTWYTPSMINKKRNIIRRWENKKKNYARAKHQTAHIELLERYIADMGINKDELIFPFSSRVYSNKIQEYGQKAEIELFNKKGSGAYIMRHTFATQALEHDVSIEVVAEIGGWKTTDVIRDYYAGLKESKIDREILDKKTEGVLTWREWISQFTPYFKAKYEEIIREKLRGNITPENIIKVRTPIKWGTYESWASSDKTQPHIKKMAKKALKLREQGLPDDEIRIKMGWV